MITHTRQDAELKEPTSPMVPMPNTPVPTVFIHHTAIAKSGSPKKDVQVVDSSERGRGYICGAYHELADENGESWEIRVDGGKVKLGAATKNNNSNSLALVFNGNFQFDTLTVAQLECASQIIAKWVGKDWARRSFVVRPHCDVFATACPGLNLKPHLGNIALRTHEILGSNPVTPSPVIVVPPVSSVPFPLIQIDWYGETNTIKGTYGYVHCHSGKYNERDRPAIIMIQDKLDVKNAKGQRIRDGIIDPGGSTAQAIYNFQVAHKIKADKAVGGITWHILFG